MPEDADAMLYRFTAQRECRKAATYLVQHPEATADKHSPFWRHVNEARRLLAKTHGVAEAIN